MMLLNLEDGRLSLEFDDAERDVVRHALSSLGELDVTAFPTYAIVTVAGEQLVYLNEWDEPCLIAKTPVGDAILRAIIDGQRSHAKVA